MKFLRHNKRSAFLSLAAICSLVAVTNHAQAQVSTNIITQPVLSYRCFGSIQGGGITNPLMEGSKVLDKCREADGRTSYATGCDVASAGIIGRLHEGGHIGLLAKFTNITRASASICLVMSAVASSDQQLTINGGTGSGVLGPNWYGCSNDATSIALGRRAYISGNGEQGMAYCDYQLDLGIN